MIRTVKRKGALKKLHIAIDRNLRKRDRTTAKKPLLKVVVKW